MTSTAIRKHPNEDLPIRWYVAAWFIAVHLLGAVAIWYMYAVHFSWATVVFAMSFFLVRHLSITAGMHRLHAHPTYRARKPLELFLLIVSASTFQTATRIWAYLHRMHHRYEDTDLDPYSVVHGFWWAHFRWILYTPSEVNPKMVGDLTQNKLVMWQERNYYPLAIGTGLLFPTAVASLWGDALGGLLVAGFLCLTVQYHATWCINSVAHKYGTFRYKQIGTARSQGHWVWFPALTVGEGTTHDRHHYAQGDYRIDPRRWALDIGKWFIDFCVLIGQAYDRRTISEEIVHELARRKAARNT